MVSGDPTDTDGSVNCSRTFVDVCGSCPLGSGSRSGIPDVHTRMVVIRESQLGPADDDGIGLDAIFGRVTVRLVAWADTSLEFRGVDPRSRYAELFWLPVLGPSTMWLLRHFVWRLDLSPKGAELVLPDVARSVGIGHRAGRSAPFFRTVSRAIDFGMVRVEAFDVISSRRRLPLVSPKQLSRLPDSLRMCHERWVRSSFPHESPRQSAIDAPSVAVTARS